MKVTLVLLALAFSIPVYSSCEDSEGIGAISMSSTSPWFLTTFLMTGDDPTVDCKIVKELRSDAQQALVEGSVSAKLAKALEKMENAEESKNLTINEKLELIINNTTAL